MGRGEQMAVTEKMASEMYPAEYMYAYARIDGSMNTILRNVADWTKNSTTVLSEDQAKVDMFELLRRTVQGRRYRWNAATHAPEQIQPAEGQTTADVTQAMPAALQTPNCLFIHLDLIGERDAIEEGIRHCYSNMLDQEKRYLTGQSLDSQKPYLFRVRTVRPEDGRDQYVTDFAKEVTDIMKIVFPDIDHTSGTGAHVSGPQRLTCHYDELSRRARAEKLYLDSSDPTCCSFAAYEEYATRPVPLEDPLYGKRQLMYTQDLYGQYPETLSTVRSGRGRKRRIEDVDEDGNADEDGE